MLANRVAKGALWLITARLATKALDLVAMLIVARLLAPADFGLFALAATVLLVMDAITDLSLSNAIVQMQAPSDDVYDTAFTLGLCRGLLVALLIVAIAWPFAKFYGDARLASIIQALSAIPLLRSLASPRIAALQRQLLFRPTFYLEAAGKTAAFGASVAAALVTRSYWALVAGMIAAPALSTLLSYRFAPYRPAFGIREWKPILAFSGWLTLANTVNTLNWQADRLLIGGRLGTNVLGQYAVGSELASLPTNAPVQPIMQALYAGFARLSADRDRLSTAYLLSQSFVLSVALPLGIIVSVFAYPIVQLTLGPEWSVTALVLQILTPILSLQMITGPAQALAMVTGNTRQILYRDVWMLVVRFALIGIGITAAGLIGVIVARVGSGIFIILLNLLLVRKIIGVSVLKQTLAPWRIYCSGGVLALCLVLLGEKLQVLDSVTLSDIPLIVAIIAFCIPIYLICDFALWSITRPASSVEARLLQVGSQFLQSSKVKNAGAA